MLGELLVFAVVVLASFGAGMMFAALFSMAILPFESYPNGARQRLLAESAEAPIGVGEKQRKAMAPIYLFFYLQVT
jgi:hypothetical protein